MAATLSPYGYVAGDPLNGTDPTGLDFGFLGLGCAWHPRPAELPTGGQLDVMKRGHHGGEAVGRQNGRGLYGGSFRARVLRRPGLVDQSLCIGWPICAEACTGAVPGQFNEGAGS